MIARADGLLKTSSLSFNRLSQNVSVLLLSICMDMDACINYMSTISKMAIGSQAYSAHWWWWVTPFVLPNPGLD